MCRSRRNRDEQAEDPQREHNNPFIAFRHYADEQVSSLMNMFGVPTHSGRERDDADWRNQRWGCHRRRWNRDNKQDQDNATAAGALHGDERGSDGAGDSFFDMLKEMDTTAREWAHEWDEVAKHWQSKEEEWKRFFESCSANDSERTAPRRGLDGNAEDSPYGKPQVWFGSWTWPPRGEDEKRRVQATEEFWHDLERLLETSERVHKKDDFGTWAWHAGWPGSEHDQKRSDATTRSAPPLDQKTAAWLNQSPHSPLMLESLHLILARRVNWRDAYEDLVRAEKGLPLIPKEDLGRSAEMEQQQWARERLGRFGGLREKKQIQKAETSPADRSETKQFEASPASETTELPHTELDLYEHVLAPAAQPSPLAASKAESPQPASSVLSTLTTTERSVAADGSVTTKVVLKKRFSDGREENSESVHTVPAGKGGLGSMNQLVQTKAEKPNVLEAVKSQQERKGGRGGWFWSS